MTNSKFTQALFLSILGSLVVLTGINYFLGDNGDWNLGILGIVLFTVLSLIVFYVCKRTLRSKDKYLFIRIIIINVIIKILACFVLVAVYYKYTMPESRFFILPFLMVYLIFTVFETHFLLVQSKVETEQSKSV